MAKTKKSLDEYDRSLLDANDIVKLLLNNNSLNGVICIDNEEREKFYKNSEQILGKQSSLLKPDIDLSRDEFHIENINKWNVPDEYFEIDIEDYLVDRCETQFEIDRISKELEMFESRNLTHLLHVFIYLVDIMRKNNIVWGVGRGSSVSSYCLYKIGIHHVNSLKYNLDIKEFLK